MSAAPTPYPFQQVDVFTATPYYGNPVAVVNCLDTTLPAPSQEQMQRFARWTNLSKTTFILPPSNSSADYKLKIFTPVEELPFAGHPTLGSCHSFLQHLGADKSRSLIASRQGKLVQECEIGLVPLCVADDASFIELLAPDFIHHEPVDAVTVSHIVKGLCLDPSDVVEAWHINNGPPWMGFKLQSAEKVLNIDPNAPDCDTAPLRDMYLGFIGPHEGGKSAEGEKLTHEVRAFCFGDIGEDPVTGSLNAGFAKWLEMTGETPADEYTNSQGTKMGRKGRVSVRVDRSKGDGKPDIWIGGSCVVCITGTVNI